MGFFSWVGSTIGSIASGISNVVSSISSGLSAAIDRVGEIIKSGISTLGKLVTTTIKTLRDICPKGANFLHEISQAVTKLLTPVLGPFLAPVVTSIIMDVINDIFVSLLTPTNEKPLDNEQIEEYGALLEESERNNWGDGDKFDTVNEHYEYLKSKAKEGNVEIKPVEKLSVESMKRRSIAMSELWDRLEKREEITISQDFLIFSALKAFTPERVQAIIDASKEMGFSAVKFSDLRDGKLDPDITKRYNLTIVSKLKEIYENKGITITDDEAINELANMKTAVEEIKFMEPLKDKFDSYADLGERLFDKNSLENEYKIMG
ncbi:MAG: hypothetical protein E6422_02735 [Veillonella sp.]|uniref:hypothetical protein n=1 Tax=Veillonella sp. TaxID=1926307 RepID=UPI00290BCF42|nr:hypothetical protein [Veillonella sp.]MDU6787064.1 hypothetical protein [Veillonella sp.]